MAKCINKAFLLGHVSNDPELRTTSGGTPVASFSLATSDRLKDREGNWSEKTQWHHVVAFGRIADVVRDYVRKGAQLQVEGRLETRSWKDRSSDQKKHKTEVIVMDLTLLGGNDERLPAGNHSKSAATPDHYVDRGIADDDIPY